MGTKKTDVIKDKIDLLSAVAQEELSDHYPVYENEILSWNIMNQGSASPAFTNNGFNHKEDTEAYKQRLTKIANAIIEELSEKRHLNIVCLQEVPCKDPFKTFFLEALTSALNQKNADLVKLAKPKLNFMVSQVQATAAENSGRLILINADKYAAAPEKAQQIPYSERQAGRVQIVNLTDKTTGKKKAIGNVHLFWPGLSPGEKSELVGLLKNFDSSSKDTTDNLISKIEKFRQSPFSQNDKAQMTQALIALKQSNDLTHKKYDEKKQAKEREAEFGKNMDSILAEIEKSRTSQGKNEEMFEPDKKFVADLLAQDIVLVGDFNANMSKVYNPATDPNNVIPLKNTPANNNFSFDVQNKTKVNQNADAILANKNGYDAIKPPPEIDIAKVMAEKSGKIKIELDKYVNDLHLQGKSFDEILTILQTELYTLQYSNQLQAIMDGNLKEVISDIKIKRDFLNLFDALINKAVEDGEKKALSVVPPPAPITNPAVLKVLSERLPFGGSPRIYFNKRENANLYLKKMQYTCGITGIAGNFEGKPPYYLEIKDGDRQKIETYNKGADVKQRFILSLVSPSPADLEKDKKGKDNKAGKENKAEIADKADKTVAPQPPRPLTAPLAPGKQKTEVSPVGSRSSSPDFNPGKKISVPPPPKQPVNVPVSQSAVKDQAKQQVSVTLKEIVRTQFVQINFQQNKDIADQVSNIFQKTFSTVFPIARNENEQGNLSFYSMEITPYEYNTVGASGGFKEFNLPANINALLAKAKQGPAQQPKPQPKAFQAPVSSPASNVPQAKEKEKKAEPALPKKYDHPPQGVASPNEMMFQFQTAKKTSTPTPYAAAISLGDPEKEKANEVTNQQRLLQWWKNANQKWKNPIGKSMGSYPCANRQEAQQIVALLKEFGFLKQDKIPPLGTDITLGTGEKDRVEKSLNALLKSSASVAPKPKYP